MADIQISISAKDDASRVIQKANGEIVKMGGAAATARDFMNGLGVSFDVMTNPAELAGKALAKVGQVISDSVNEYVAYGKQVGDVSRQLGVSAEEASKLIQVSDDLEIEFSSLKMALRTAQKDGIAPTLQGIKDLATEYRAIVDPTERAAFAMDKFGRSGLEMQKLLELAPEKIDEMAASAEKAGLVMDGEGVKAAQEYREALDALGDSWTGIKNQIGKGVVPILLQITTVVNDGIEAQQDMAAETDKVREAYKRNMITQEEYQIALAQVQRGYGDQGAAAIKAISAIDDYNQTVQGAIDNAAEYEDGHTRAASAVVTVTDAVVEETAAIVTETQSMQDYQAALLGVVDARQKYLNQATAFILAQVESQQQARNIELERRVEREGRASGGPVMAGRSYVVGEQGPEAFVPTQNGMIIPASQTRNVTNNIYTSGLDAQALAQALAMEIGRY